MHVQGGWTAIGPVWEEDISWAGARLGHQAGSFFGGSKGGRLSGLKDDVSDRIVAVDSVAVASTADLVVSERVSRIDYSAEHSVW